MVYHFIIIYMTDASTQIFLVYNSLHSFGEKPSQTLYNRIGEATSQDVFFLLFCKKIEFVIFGHDLLQ